ncbi:protein DGCR6-like isoform X1 [Biomphalaria glabrata]|uniref:Protein DGCR6-like isoform X1 n=1 Tax=Biomphalaria glabrata TaxID=6526 RepID=A0A9U8ECK8_BIOGL|nr:protein DGCR6-like isoform X1 [Biomphalaria glabrata]XP_013081342.2 protein DGCR6-like isoform X1 [Biomphalaria glabrata]XP_013081344.2 protein DGCR6-like isoform X1 [Biomphalaria glabrata]XP_055887743.1 protein DGCR6-like isoform X1 [Biomphalaria glabrata]KAI8773016.1 protein DGCR6 isoform X1 [Biomphalaria glabrata]
MMLQDQSNKEELQHRHYVLLNELQKMSRELPGKFQQRLSYDLLSALASALLDGTAFEIVKGLEEVQHLEEKSLFTQRQKLINDHKSQRHEMNKKHKELLLENQNKPHNLPLIEAQVERELDTMERRCEEEMKKRDAKIILELDQKLMDQQSMLEKAGVPGFYVTNNRQDVRLQMYLLEFITRLAAKEKELRNS